MKRLLLSITVLMFSFAVMAQDADTLKPWKIGGDVSLTFSQVSFTNWAAGGDNSFSGLATFSVFADYAKNKHIWNNFLTTAYGLQKIKKDPYEKTQDKLDIMSNYGYEAFRHWYYSANLSFSTQYDKGYDSDVEDSLVSDFLSPGYILAGLGLTYQPNDNFYVTLSPIAYKMTIVNNQDLANLGAFGLDPAEFDTAGTVVVNAKKIRNEFGASLKAMFKKEVVKNVVLWTYLELFSNYLEDPQNIDVKWDVIIDFKINNWLTANLQTNLVYDHDIMIKDKNGAVGPRTQFKQAFGLGLAYRFGYVKEK